MDVVRGDEITAAAGPADWFEGQVSLQQLIEDALPGGSKVYRVRFEAGARTHWHTHEGEQLLYVLEGVCELEERDGALVRLHAGDVGRIPPGVEHWHGAGPDGAMVHLAVTAGGTDWRDPVNEDGGAE